MSTATTYAHFIPPTPESGLDPFSKTQSRRQRICNVVSWILHLTLVVAVCFLLVKVRTLEHMQSLVDDVATRVVVADGTGNPRVQQSDDEFTDRSKFRFRRDSNPPPDGQAGTGWGAPGSISNHTHAFIHVTHINEQIMNLGDWFTWHSDQEAEYQHLSTSLMLIRHNKFIEVTQPGYYFVYSQITYSDTNAFGIGHEIVKKANCGVGEDQILLSSRQSQIDTDYSIGVPNYPQDSGYVGGVFYFSANDRIGVRPLSDPGQPDSHRFGSHLITGSYFGAFVLASDPNARVADWTDCCEGSILMK